MFDINELLQGIFGDEATIDNLSSYDSSQWVTALADKFDLNEEDLNESMFPGISESLVKSAKYSTYAPSIESGTQSALSKLLNVSKGKGLSKSYGGFAGTSNVNQFKSQVKDAYGKDVQPFLSSARQNQLSSGKSILDQIQSYVKSASDIRYS